MPNPIEPIERDLMRSAACVEINVTKTEKQPTSADDWHVHDEGRFGDEDDDDVEFAGISMIYVVGLLSRLALRKAKRAKSTDEKVEQPSRPRVAGSAS